MFLSEENAILTDIYEESEKRIDKLEDAGEWLWRVILLDPGDMGADH